MTDIALWHDRAGWLQQALLSGEQSPVRLARRRLDHWAALLPPRGSGARTMVPSRELRAAAHPPGMHKGEIGDAVAALRHGCLTLSGPVGGGKTTAACWKAYQTDGAVLWLDAVRVAVARTGQIDRWLDEIRSASFVMVDDVGAAGTVGQYETPRVAAILTAVAARQESSIVSTNLAKEAFGGIYDRAAEGGRLVDRLCMRPNRWLALPTGGRSRREEVEEPPGENVLPPREAKAHGFLVAAGALAKIEEAEHVKPADERAVMLVARALGISTTHELDARVERYRADRAAIDQICLSLVEGALTRWRDPPAGDQDA